nr:ribonuclease H-like domain-containing protein [Tanacetum cinerariifolium]
MMIKVTDLETNMKHFKIEQAAINSDAAKQWALLQATIEKNSVEADRQFAKFINALKALQPPITLPEDTTTMIDTKKVVRTVTGFLGCLLTYLCGDIILTASCPALLQQIIGSLSNEFDMTDLGALNYFLGISVDRTSTGLFLSHKKYALQLIERAHMVTCNPSRTPIDIESKLGLEVQHIFLYMHDPRESYLAALKRILRYVPSTLDLCLHLYASSTTSLVGYTDADWKGCPSTRSTEAEYRGVANVVVETAWLRNLFRELHSPLLTATLIYCDNVSAVYMSVNPVQHQRTKHIEIDIHFVGDMVTAGQVRVLHVPSYFQYADIFTKGLLSALFEEF